MTGVTSKDVFRLDNLWAGSCLLTVRSWRVFHYLWANAGIKLCAGDLSHGHVPGGAEGVPVPAALVGRLLQRTLLLGREATACSIVGLFCPLCLHSQGVPWFQGRTHHEGHSCLLPSLQDLYIHHSSAFSSVFSLNYYFRWESERPGLVEGVNSWQRGWNYTVLRYTF